MASCPTCGQAAPETDLLIDLERNLIRRGNVTVKLRPRTAELLAVLARHAPHLVPIERLITGMWGGGREPLTAVNVIRQSVSELRRRLRPFGLTIETCHSRGYALIAEPAAAARLTRARQAA